MRKLYDIVIKYNKVVTYRYLIISCQSLYHWSSNKDTPDQILVIVEVPIFTLTMLFGTAGCMQKNAGNWKQPNRE